MALPGRPSTCDDDVVRPRPALRLVSTGGEGKPVAVRMLTLPRFVQQHDRLTLAAIAGWLLFIGVAFMLGGNQPDVVLDALWGPWFVAAGLLTAGYAARPWSSSLRAWSGAAAILAPLGRALGLAGGALVESAPLGVGRVVVTCAVWSMLAFSFRLLWARLLPERRRTVRQDRARGG